MKTKEEVLEAVREFVGGSFEPGADLDMVSNFISSNCSWLDEESLVFPSSWLREEDLGAVLEEFFIGNPVIYWDGYMFQFAGVGIWEAKALVFCKEGKESRYFFKNLFIFSKSLISVLNKVLEKEENWWDK